MSDRRERAYAIVHNNVAWSCAAGLVPLPIVDLATLTLVEVRMLEQLTTHYNLPFSRTRARAYVAALFGSFGATMVGFGSMKVAMLSIPYAGPFVAAVSVPTVAGVITYAIGRLFIREFESGGTFMDFDPIQAHSAEVERCQRANAVGANSASVCPDVQVRPVEPEVVVEPIVAPPPPPPVQVAPPPPAPIEDKAPPVAKKSNGKPDDLEIVLGIGPKIAELLHAQGITTFAGLAVTPVETIQKILDDGGRRYAQHDPSTWPKQAQLLAEGRKKELEAMWQELRAHE